MMKWCRAGFMAIRECRPRNCCCRRSRRLTFVRSADAATAPRQHETIGQAKWPLGADENFLAKLSLHRPRGSVDVLVERRLDQRADSPTFGCDCHRRTGRRAALSALLGEDVRFGTSGTQPA